MSTAPSGVLSQISREHHFVPRFLLRGWVVDGKIAGYYRARDGSIRSRELGVGAFCKELDLLAIRAHGKSPDALEKQFFGHVDTRGAVVAKKLLASGPDGLTAEERSDFGRLLLSLEVRYPENVARLRGDVANQLKDLLDSDTEVLRAIADAGEARKPSEIYEDHAATDFASRALLLSQKLVDNAEVGGRLINAAWRVYHLRQTDGTLLLADRPLVRCKGYDEPASFWMLPLTPKAVFVAANSQATVHAFDRASGHRFRKRANANSIAQAARYIFAVDKSHEAFINKNLPRNVL
jgi:Protein of unknown function (DUF4238)